MKKMLLKFLNPIHWVKAYRFSRANSRYDKSSFDLELYLYSRILRNDMLHYGYFENAAVEPDTISIKQFEDAQVQYANNIIELINNNQGTTLDVGCGMGGLSGMLHSKNINVEALTPNHNQVDYIRKKHPQITVHHKKFEEFKTNNTYSTIINSESLQYIKLEDAFKNVGKMLEPGGRWIICDYFRKAEQAANRSGHIYDAFIKDADKNGWKVVYEKNITENIMPTVKYINMYAQRFLLPIKHFAFEKLRYKKAWLYYMTQDLRSSIDTKINKELKTVDPEVFFADKMYILLALERKG